MWPIKRRQANRQTNKHTLLFFIHEFHREVQMSSLEVYNNILFWLISNSLRLKERVRHNRKYTHFTFLHGRCRHVCCRVSCHGSYHGSCYGSWYWYAAVCTRAIASVASSASADDLLSSVTAYSVLMTRCW